LTLKLLLNAKRLYWRLTLYWTHITFVGRYRFYLTLTLPFDAYVLVFWLTLNLFLDA
jgi:hypothetical protein